VPFEAISESTADDLTARGIERRRIRVIRPGIDHARFRPDLTPSRFDVPTFLYVGRLKRYKGLERVIDAVAALARDGVDARLLVAGKGDHERALRAHASRRARDRVRFLGYITEREKVDLLRRAWATVYPSPKEGWGITNIEAAACGTPSIASDAPGLRESVSDGRSGLLVPHEDPDAWRLALKRIACDDGLRHQLQEGAVGYAARFSWDRAADETESHLQEIVSGARGRAALPAER
jgi:glycosyltransferase involved in cell wall biosynthesis